MAKLVARNKDAFFKYDLLDKFEAGIELQGWEIKSIRQAQVNIKNCFVNIHNHEAFLVNMYIKSYMTTQGEELRSKKLLLHKKQIRKLAQAQQTQHLSIIATKLWLNQKGLAKIEIALAKGRTQGDKREIIKKRDIERKLQRKYKR